MFYFSLILFLTLNQYSYKGKKVKYKEYINNFSSIGPERSHLASNSTTGTNHLVCVANSGFDTIQFL